MTRRRIKRPDGQERRKAAPDMYPDEGPCPIADGFDQLTRKAFAVWIRLSVADPEELQAGRARVSEMLGYSKRQGDEVLRELERSGFIAFLPEGPWQRTTIVVARKPLLQRGHGFTRFS